MLRLKHNKEQNVKHPEIKQAVHDAVENGLSYGAPTEAEILMAEKVRNEEELS